MHFLARFGLIGSPNSGKTTVFNLVTDAGVKTEMRWIRKLP